ncbi:salicylate synthase [Marinomonas sp. C1424]|uniref:Salicylate synthase n=1 Tax=Marinomonas transparens TaxID=2795388 RepID=A0A934N0C7_9GAMM|nr:salicylate synthase [Marinomonas transparens]
MHPIELTLKCLPNSQDGVLNVNDNDLNLNMTNSNTKNHVFKLAATLASSHLFEDYMIYEKDGECWFGGGIERSVTLYADRLESSYNGQSSVVEVADKTLFELLNTELSSWEGAWQANGWACFELAYALNDPSVLNDDEQAGKVPLLFLSQPKAIVSLGQQSPEIQTQDETLKQKINELLNTPKEFNASANGVSIPDSEEYKQWVNSSLTEIEKGTLEKVILSRKLKLDFSPDFVATWLRGRTENTPARSFSLNLGGWQASGFSPELVMSVDKNRIVTTEPLAGTRRRDGILAEDLSRFNELYRDPKETHEHAISVYLATNELKAVCNEPSIVVRQFMERKERGSVQHLASTVCGELKDELNPWDAFASLFPSVTASGIPKKPAFKEIRRNEVESRGLYAGAILRISHDGTFDAALVLRSLLGHKGKSWLQAGAGIVSHSTPERELTETTEKLSSVAPWVMKQMA